MSFEPPFNKNIRMFQIKRRYSFKIPMKVLVSCFAAPSLARKHKLKRQGKTAEVSATVVPPIRFRTGPKLGTLNATKMTVTSRKVLIKTLWAPNSEITRCKRALYWISNSPCAAFK